MACVLTRVDGDPNCNFEGAAGSKVTLVIVPKKGNARFAAASYDGTSLIDAAAQKITFTTRAGSRDLSVVFTFSDSDGTAHLVEDCANAEVLDDNISAVNNAKLYAVCGRAADALPGAAKKTMRRARKSAAKKASRKRRRSQ